MNARPAILFAITGVLVGGLLLFCAGGDRLSTEVKNTSGLRHKKSVNTPAARNNIATPFGASPNAVESPLGEIATESLAATPHTQAPQEALTPLQLIDAYMTAWSGNNYSETQSLWNRIARCPECLQQIKTLLMNQSVPQGMLLELTDRAIELGDPAMLPVFDYLLQPSVDMNTRIIVTQQMIKDGRAMYVRKLFDNLQQADMDGMRDAAKHTWMISRLKNPQGIEALFDVISGRSGASHSFSEHVSNVFNNTLLGIRREGVTEVMVDYYASADGTEQHNLWKVISLHSESLLLLSKRAYDAGDLNQFTKYTDAMAAVDSVSAVEHMLELASQVDYPQEHFIAMMSTSTRRFNNLEVFHKLEDRLRNPKADKRSRIVAAEGLLAVKEFESARYILQKTLNSTRYEDAEIAAYISARL